LAKIIISKLNYFHNLSVISKHVKDKEKIAVVLKDNAYGHGLIEIATLASEFGVTKAVVQTLDDAIKIEKLFEEILILADKNIHTYSHTFHITINELKDIITLPKNTNVHLKIDTGMHRNGISKNELKEAIHGICKQGLNLTGVYTHYRSADELSCEYFCQKDEFKKIKADVKITCEELLLPIPNFHSANSSGVFRESNFDEDMVRVGIATYGYLETDEIYKIPNLKPVLSLHAKRLSTRKLFFNEKVGYGGKFKAKKDMIISTYDIGYGDGFLRINENQQYTTPEGFNILGRVSMDNMSLDTTKEEICLFNDVRQLAKIHDTITYEILTSLKDNIKKEIV
jgi:alanine racemase